VLAVAAGARAGHVDRRELKYNFEPKTRQL